MRVLGFLLMMNTATQIFAEEQKCNQLIRGVFENAESVRAITIWSDRLSEIKLNGTVNVVPFQEQKSAGDKSTELSERVFGVPTFAKRILAGKTVFRRYGHIDKILERKILEPGNVPYIKVSDRKQSFEDLTGIFLTLPGKGEAEIGVDPNKVSGFVDLTLPPDIPVWELEPGNIYLIALPRRVPDWLVEKFNNYKRGESIDPAYKEACELLEKSGGIWPVKSVPVQILKSSDIR